MGNEVKRCVVISGAPYDDFSFLKEKISEDDYVICADRGVETAKKAGIHIDVALGDFDTVEKPLSDDFGVITLPCEKDVADTFYACSQAASMGFRDVYIFCALGGRADHTFANFLCLNSLLEMGVSAKIIDRQNCIFLADERFEISASNYKYLSLFAFLSDVPDLSLEGVKYPLQNHFLSASSALCISNEIDVSSAKVSFSDGKLLVFLTKD